MYAAIQVEGLHKSYGAFEAVRGISFGVARGEVVALLGPNGAGKTTTVEILEGYRKPTAGTVRVLGVDPWGGGAKLRERVGIVLQEAGFPPELTVAELVSAWRRFYHDPMGTGEVLEAVGLGSKAETRAKSLSGGEHRRLDLALGLVGQPEVLFLDEPTTGFDPSARRTAWELIEHLVRQGMTLLLTTHYLDEAQRLAKRMMIITEGRIAAEGTAEEIASRAGSLGTISFDLPRDVGVSDLPPLGEGAMIESNGDEVCITTTDLLRTSHAITAWALERGWDLPAFRASQPTLEEVYLDIIGRQRP